MLKIPVEFDRTTSSAKFKNISLQIPASLPGVSAVTREIWWMNQELTQTAELRSQISDWYAQ
jgi:hypothetical protein